MAETSSNSINNALQTLAQAELPAGANGLSYYDTVQPTVNTPNALAYVDPRKVYLARELGITDGLNAIEKDFASNDLQTNVAKYGDQAYAVDSKILSTSGEDVAKSFRERSAARALSDTVISGLNGAVQSGIGALEAVNLLNPVTNAIDTATGANTKGFISKGLSTVSNLVQNLADAGTSDVVLHDRLIRGYKTQLEENLHAREEQEAVARGESPLTAMLTRIAKDIGSGVNNATSTSVGLLDSAANVVGSVAAMGLTTKGAGLAARGITSLGKKLAGTEAKTALTVARDQAAEQAAARAATATRGENALPRAVSNLEDDIPEYIPEYMPDYIPYRRPPAMRLPDNSPKLLEGSQASYPVKPYSTSSDLVPVTTSSNKMLPTAQSELEQQGKFLLNNEASAANTISKGSAIDASKGALEAANDTRSRLEKFVTHPRVQIGAHEGGSAGLQTYDTVQSMSDEELMTSSEQYRKAKQEYLDQGYSEEEAQYKAKEDVANSASTRSAAYAGAIAAVAGGIMDKATIKGPMGQFVDVTAKKALRETAEEGAENLSQFGSNLAAKQTYNNDQDMAEGVGTAIGEGAASAGAGTFMVGAPSMAKRQIKNAFKKTAGAAVNALENVGEKKNIKTINQNAEALDNIISTFKNVGTEKEVNPSATGINAPNNSSTFKTAFNNPDDYSSTTNSNTTTKTDSDPLNGNIFSKQGAADALQKVKDAASSTFTKDEVDSFNADLGTEAFKENTPKIDAVKVLADSLNKSKVLNHPEFASDEDKLLTLRQVSALQRLHNSIFQSQPIDNILSNIDDENTKLRVKAAYDAYAKLGSNKKYQNAIRNANKFAQDIVTANDNIDNVYADSSLSDMQRRNKINAIIEAYKYLVASKIATKEQLDSAEKAAKFIKNHNDQIFFLKEVATQKQNLADIEKAEEEEKATAEAIRAALKDIPSDEVDFSKESTAGKNLSEVSKEKLETIYDDDETNRLSFTSVFLKMTKQRLNGDAEGAHQTILDYMNYTQSQLNKLNAWRQSKADNIRANKNAKKGDKRIYAEPVDYATYNPQSRIWSMADHGIHAGSIEYGAIMLKENQLLKNQFNLLKTMFFDSDPNLNLVDNSDSTVTDDFINKEYDKYLKSHGRTNRFTDSIANTDLNIKRQNQAQANTTTAKSSPKASANTAKQAATTAAPKQATGSTATAKQTGFNAASAFNTTKVRTPAKGAITSFHGTDGKPGFLSNFYDSPITYEGRTYNNVESAFQAAKSADDGIKDMFTDMTGTEAKKFGRKVKLRSDWESTDSNGVPTKVKVMGNILREKFKNPELRKQLLATGDAQLIEGNNWKDNYWGAVQNQSGEYVGANVLGQLLQQIRSEIRNEEAKPQQKQAEPVTNNSDETQAQQATVETTNTNQETVEANNKARSFFANEEATRNTAEQQANIARQERITAIRNKAFGFKKEKENSFVNILNKIKTLVSDGLAGEDNNLSATDVASILQSLDFKNPNSLFNVFKKNFAHKLFSLDDGIVSDRQVPIPVDENSIFLKEGIANKNELTGRVTISYKDILNALNTDITLLDRASDAEITALYDAFPMLIFLNVANKDHDKGLYRSYDTIGTIFLNAVAYFNNHKGNSGLSYDRIAESLGSTFDEMALLRDSEGNHIGINILKQAAAGSTEKALITGLGGDIRKSLGISIDPHMSYDTHESFISALTGAVVESLVDAGIVTKTTYKEFNNGITIYSLIGSDGKVTDSLFNTLENPEGLDKLLANTREKDTGVVCVEGQYNGDTSINPYYEQTNIKLPKEAADAVKNYSKTGYRANTGMLDIYQSLGKDGICALYGEDVSDPDNMDPADLISKKGRNLEHIGAFDQVFKWYNQIQKVADKAGVSVDKVRKYFKLGMTRVGRIQELEAYGPIANKLTREAILSTWGTIPLTGDAKEVTIGKQELARAVLQNFGGKLNKTNFEDSYKAFNSLVDAIEANPDNFKNLLALTNEKAVSVETIKNSEAELASFMSSNADFAKIHMDSVDRNFMSLHAQHSLARYIQARKTNDNSFTTSLYCEADGTTNGTINTNYLFTLDISEAIGLSPDLGMHAIRLTDAGNMRLGDRSGDSAGKVKSKIETSQQDAYGMSGRQAQAELMTQVENIKDQDSWHKLTEEEASKRNGAYVGAPTPDQMLNSVQTLFKLSGQTKAYNINLEDEITRNFMKSPCTKAMYNAGVDSVNNTFIKAILDDAHAKRTAVMRAEKTAGRPLTKLEVAEAMFKGIKEANDNWKEPDPKYKNVPLYMVLLDNYLFALNSLTQNTLSFANEKIKGKDTTVIKVKRYFFNRSYNNLPNKQVGFNARKQITYRSFCANPDKLDGNINFDTETLGNLSLNVKNIYGKPIYQAITAQIKAGNVRGSQNVMQRTSSIASAYINAVILSKVSKIDPSLPYDVVKKQLGNLYGETIENNYLDFGDSKIEVAYNTNESANEMAGGSVYNSAEFGKYTKENTTSKYKFGSSSFGEVSYNYLEKPGVRSIPTTAINRGDGMMMQNAMNKLLDKLGHVFTLIFDGANVPVGKQKEFGNAINRIQYETDTANPLEAFAVKARALIDHLSSKELPLKDVCQVLADALSLKKSSFTSAGVDIVLALSNELFSLIQSNTSDALFARNKAIDEWCKDINTKLEKSGNTLNHWNSQVFTRDMFSPQNNSFQTFKSKVKEYIFKDIQNRYPHLLDKLNSEDTLSFTIKNAKELNALVQKGYLKPSPILDENGKQVLDKNGKPKYETAASALAAKYRDLLSEILTFYTGHLEDRTQGEKTISVFIHNRKNIIPGNTDKPIVPGYPVYGVVSESGSDFAITDLFAQVTGGLFDEAIHASRDIATIQVAKYLMGGTYDHMASHDSPYVAVPSKAEFKSILDKFHLVPKQLSDTKSYTYNEIWEACMEGMNSPNDRLITLQENCLDSASFLNFNNLQKRADILREFNDIIRRMTDYKLPSVNMEVTDKVKPYHKNLRIQSVKDYLHSVTGSNQNLSNRLKHFFDSFNMKGIGRNTKIVTIVGKNKQEQIETLKAKYSDDIDAVNAQIYERNKARQDKWRERIASKQLPEGFAQYAYQEDYLTGDNIDEAVSEIENSPNSNTQFYDAVTDTIYIVPTNPSGLENKAQEDLTRTARLPHEIFHALSIMSLKYFGDLLKDGKTSAEFAAMAREAKSLASQNKFRRKALALKAYNRLSSLMGEVNKVIPDTVDSIPDSFFQLKSYIQNIKNNSNMSEEAKLKEFVAYFGTMTDEEIQQVTEALAKSNPNTLKDMAVDTHKDALTLKNIIYAVRHAFATFIASLFGWKPEDASVQKIIYANMAIMNSVTNEDVTNSKKSDVVKMDFTLSGEDDTINFLKESESPNDDIKVDVDAETASTTFNAKPRTSKQYTLKDLSNSLISAVKAKYRDVDPSIPGSGRRNLKKVMELANLRARLNSQDPKKFNIINNVIEPLENLGFTISDKQSFANVVNILSYVKDIKSPFYGDMALASKHVLDNLYAENFCTNIKDQGQMSRGANIVRFLQGIGANSLPTDMITPVIFALSQSDPKFKKILSKMKINNSKRIDDYLYADKLFNKFTDKVYDKINTVRNISPSKTEQEAFDKLLARMCEDEVDFSKNNFVQDFVDKAENLVNKGITKFTNAAAKRLNIDPAIANKLPTDIENAMNNQDWIPHMVKELVHDVMGRTKDNYDFYTMNTKVKVTTQQTRQQTLEQSYLAIREKFGNSVTNEQWERFSKTIGKSGLATLFEADTDALASLLSDASAYKAKMSELKGQIVDDYRISKCRQLAKYMVTGYAGKMLIRNPMAIAKKLGSSNKGYAPSEAEIRACDKLTSLFALEYLTKGEKAEIAKLLKTQPKGMKNILNMAKSQYEEGTKKALGSRKAMNNWYKASLSTTYKSGRNFKVAPISSKNEMERMGYELIQEYSGSNLDTTKMGIFYSRVNQKNPFNPGAIQFTGSTANGINLRTGASLHPNAGMITNPKLVKNILNNMGRYSSKLGEDLLPVFNAEGNVVAFERSLDPALVNNNQYLSLETDYSRLLGIQQGRNIEEKMTDSFNHEVIDLLADKYHKAPNKEDYVDLFSINDDPTISNVVDMIPSTLKKHIKEKYGNDHFMVLRSELNDVIGYHSASITDSWTGESRLNPLVQDGIVAVTEKVFGKNAFTVLKAIENGERSLVKSAKNNLIIRSVVVPATNLAANLIQLIIEGVPVQTIVKYGPQVIKEINQYIKYSSELLQIDQELSGEIVGYRKHQLEAQKNALQDAMSKLSIAYLLEKKEFSAIADLGNNDRTLDLSEGNLGDKALAYIDKYTDNDIVKSITHYGVLAEDTSLYKFLEKCNQYGDFLGKAILYKDLTERRQWTPEQAHMKIADEFVDYVRLPGRGRDFLERAGLLWFYNFKLRMMKVAMGNLKDRPLLTLALSLGGLPTPATDSLLGKLPVLSYSIGPAMMLSAFSMTPLGFLLGMIL